MRFGLTQNRYWKRADIKKLRELINEKSNQELAEIFGITISRLTKSMEKYGIKRNEEFGKSLMAHKKENHPLWKGGISENNYHYKKLQKERYPEKVKARDMLKKAVVAGKLIPKPCEFILDNGENCGVVDDVHGHHHDYTKPLDVRWLCRKHHRKIHGGTH